MQENILFEDRLYRYIYYRTQDSQDPIVYIELCVDEEERKSMEKLDFAPISDLNTFRQKLLERGICSPNILNNLKIALTELFKCCYNLYY